MLEGKTVIFNSLGRTFLLSHSVFNGIRSATLLTQFELVERHSKRRVVCESLLSV